MVEFARSRLRTVGGERVTIRVRSTASSSKRDGWSGAGLGEGDVLTGTTLASNGGHVLASACAVSRAMTVRAPQSD